MDEDMLLWFISVLLGTVYHDIDKSARDAEPVY